MNKKSWWKGFLLILFVFIFFLLSFSFLWAQNFHASFSDESSLCEDCHKSLQEYKDKYDNYCLFCHDGVIALDVKKSFSGKYRHLSGKDYQCLSCHSPHTSILENPHLLKVKGKKSREEFCMNCHFGDEKSRADFLARYEKSFHAKKLKGEEISCLGCHQGHSSNTPHLLKGNSRGEFSLSELCLSCHKSTATDFKNSYKHPLEKVSQNGSSIVECTDCHNPHFTGVENPLGSWGVSKKLQPVRVSRYEYEVCFKCHSNYSTQPPYQLDLKTLFDPQNPSYHPLLAKGKNGGIKKEAFIGDWNENSLITCSDCHGSSKGRNMHGSSNPFLLKSFIDLEKPLGGKEVCFNCHNPSAYLATSTLSRFPSHGLHSQKFSCLICHEAHGASRKFLVRETFTYQREEYRLNFISEENKGSCGTVPEGVCHKVLSYKKAY